MTTYGDTDLGQHWPRQWLVAWWHQAITWTNVALLSVRSSDIHLGAISQKIHQPPITKINLKVNYLNLYPNLPGANELSLPGPSQTTKRHFHSLFFFILYAIHVFLYSYWDARPAPETTLLVQYIESIKTTSIENFSTEVLEKIKNNI